MKIAYCMECPKPTIIAAGEIPEKIPGNTVDKDGKRTEVAAPLPSHVVQVKGKGPVRHTKVKVIEVDDQLRPGQQPQAELDRLAKDHKKKLK